MSTDRDKFDLPPRLFLYTMDQIGDMLVLSRESIGRCVHFDGRSTGVHPNDKMLARNIAAAGEKPEWRVEESEFIRWMKRTKIVPHRRLRRLPAPDDVEFDG